MSQQGAPRLGAFAIRRWLAAFALAASTGIIAISIAALGARWWWGFELLTHFRPQYVVIQLFLLAVLLALRKPRWSAVLAAAIVPNALPLLPYAPSAAAPAAASLSAEPLRVMAVNVEWRNREADRLLEIVASEAPDVLLVVELTEGWRERLRPLHDRYPYRVMSPDSGAFGIGLLSRFPLDAARPFLLESTYAIDARIRAPQGAVRLLGVHLRPPTHRHWAAERQRQLDALVRLRAGITEPLVIAGDFNLTPYSPHFTRFLSETGLRDARAGKGPAITWRPRLLPILGIPIDHCVVSAEIEVRAMKRLPAFGSDHFPILAELFIAGSNELSNE